ncbi:MAG: ABC transporter ATP-binding protein [Solirubrobacteraceae bacterium]
MKSSNKTQENGKMNYAALFRVVKIGLKEKKFFYPALLVALCLAFFSSYRPLLIKRAVDSNILEKDFNGLVYTMGLIIVILLFEVIFQFLFVFLSNFIAQNVIKDIRVNLFNKLLNANLSFFDKTPIGVLVTRCVSDISTISQVFTDGVLLILGDLISIVIVVYAMVSLNWKLALIVLLIMPIMIVLTKFFQKALKIVFVAERTQVAQLNSFVQERLSGMKVIQLFNQEQNEFNKFKELNRELKKTYLKSVFYFSLLFPAVELVSSFAKGIVIWYGGYTAILNLDLTVGDFFAFILFINMLIRPMRQIAERINNIQSGVVSSERIFQLLDSNENEMEDGILSPDIIKGKIEFKEVCFSYSDKEQVLNNISFKINAGQKIAIVGSTGSGKTTIISLLSRFYDVKKGKILIDDVEISQYKLEFIRKQISTVLQDVFLFNNTILNNINMGNENITEQQVRQAASYIEIEEFIDSLPNKFNYFVSERGSTLSMGQRQLISFLRVYVQDPSILVLDEATSSIDTESEHLIQKALEKLTKGRTSIIIAHRLSTIHSCDLILVIEKGELVESGTHEELFLKENGFYKKLYNAQFKTSVA